MEAAVEPKQEKYSLTVAAEEAESTTQNQAEEEGGLNHTVNAQGNIVTDVSVEKQGETLKNPRGIRENAAQGNPFEISLWNYGLAANCLYAKVGKGIWHCTRYKEGYWVIQVIVCDALYYNA